MRSHPRFVALALLLACLGIPGTVLTGEARTPASPHSDLPEPRLRFPATMTLESPGRVRLSWSLPAAALVREARGDGEVVLAPGFGLRPVGGGLEVPYRVEYVAIPEGAVPRLEVRAGAQPHVVALASIPLRQGVASPPGVRGAGAGGALRAGRAVGVGAEEFPVSLGRIGYFRDQRFVEVRVSPARPSSDGPSLEIHEDPAAILSWDAAAERRDAAAGAPEDPLAEPAYRRLFLNYEEGREYRVRKTGRGHRSGEPAAISEDERSFLSTTSSASAEASSADTSGTELALPAVRARIRVSRDGLVRIDQALLAGRAPALASADPRTLRLTWRGQEIPIRVVGEGDGNFGAGDFIEFYATRRVEPPMVLRAGEGVFTPIYALNDFTDTNVYWLEAGVTAPARVATLAAGPTGNVAIEPHWQATARVDTPDIFRPFGANDPWVACPRVADRSSSCIGSSCCDFPDHDFEIPLPDYAPASATSGVRVTLQGWTNGPHVADLSLNGQPLGSAPLQWTSFHAFPASFSIANTALSATTRLTVSLPGNGTGSADSVALDTIEVDYRRLFRAAGGALEFRFPDRQARFAVEGFASSTLTAYDLSRSIGGHPVGRLLTGVRVETSGTAFRAVLQQATEGGSERRFLVAEPAAIGPPDDLAEVQAPLLCDPALEADLIVVAASSLSDLAPGSPLERYISLRSGQGLRVRVVKVEDVYDQFAFGFPEPQAIRDFLACVYDTGAPPPPLYVLLLGDGTSDYKNLRGAADPGNLVAAPVHTIEDTIFAWYSADEWLADFRFDPATGFDFVPDALIGRISAGNATEVANALGKIVDYEALQSAAAWRSHGLFVAGDGNEFEDPLFVQFSQDAAAHFTAPFTSKTLFYAEEPYNGTQRESFRNDFFRELNEMGAAVVNYVGHGNFTIWDGDQIFRNADVASLTNTDRLPLFISSTCLMTGYHLDVVDSLGELLVHSTPDTGGIAVVSPSGISNLNIDAFVNEVLYDTMMGPTRERNLGAVVLAARLALAQQGSIFDLENLTLLGDPSLTLALPAPAPASGLRASAGNLRVDLAWEPSPEPVAGYHVYRTQASNPAVGRATYTRITSAPVAALVYADTQVSNTVTYAYTITAVDAGGFESAFSNFNSTCGVTEADCVRATPFNPIPPSAPTGVAATDPGVGFRVDLAWNPNPEPDLKAYRVHYGTEQGVYPFSLTTGRNASASVSGLDNGRRYFFVVTAINTSDGFTPPGSTEPLDNESPPSGEVSAVPTLIQGIRPPAMIRDLRIDRSADSRSAVLTWSRPVVDIYGGPATVTGFQVHRASSVDFKPTSDTRVATLAADATSWVDVDALTNTIPYFYIVLAADGSGLLSSASRAFPTGSNDLTAVLARDAITGLPDGNLTLSWGAVTHDIEGKPTVVDHYDLYGSSTPFGRASLSSAALVSGNIRALSMTLPIPSGRFYYFLVAVDRRGNMSPF